MEQSKKVLVSGASFAGLVTAYWMNKLGYHVTVVEIGKGLKMGGTPVDIKDQTVDIVKRMGLFEKIKASRLKLERWEFKNADDTTQRTLLQRQPGDDWPDDEFEIERDVLLNMLFDLIKNDVDFIFSNSISSLQEKEDGIDVVFKDGTQGEYALLFVCDGIHSTVRKIWFGPEARYSNFLGQYFSIAIVNKLLIDEGTLQLYSVPNKSIMLNAHNQKTDIVFTFRPAEEIAYDYRNQEQHKDLILTHFKDVGWRATELQKELLHSRSFYFDEFCQIKMSSWTKGRVALVGDAGYCASPAAGMGGSLAIIGATALADTFDKRNGNYELAFEEYNRSLRPFIDEVQTNALDMLGKLLPRTEEEIEWRNEHGF
ncbi:FAD-dependent monooxygenase [uncultured Chitinophaga sp.]|jgi:2-polyprenyl-6-methoxyphenol hydroxylase and related FAD-dependent oxidoreductases|uniref:FAD-dependent monooxygenase n=1 Tax=uncultured Chitinophaga sp. TaxID=339340 RepID=UPI0026134B69|nr:FAD-dependent monooxygenase [uncultured Chitinophaga sp.]